MLPGTTLRRERRLERARARYDWDHMAKLYLGLVLAQDGDRQRGLKEIDVGLRGLGDWLENVHTYYYNGKFWDPGRDIRNEIERGLAMIQGRDIDWKRLTASAEWVAKELEEEIERVKRDENRERMDDERDGGSDKG